MSPLIFALFSNALHLSKDEGRAAKPRHHLIMVPEEMGFGRKAKMPPNEECIHGLYTF